MRGGVCWDMSSTVVQSGHHHSLGGYQSNLMMEPHSPTMAWHMHHPISTKQEPMEEGRNDSGIQSAGSDVHSSPGSQHSEEYNVATYSAANQQNQASLYYSTPIMPRMTSSMMPYHNTMGFNPLTPPSSEPMSSPKSTNYTSPVPIKIENTEEDATLTPRSSPTHLFNENSTTENGEKRDEEDPLRRLQMTFEKNGLLPAPLSPKTSEHSIDGDNRSDIEMEEYDEQGLRIPKVNSHGKVKTFKCKQCDFIAITKLDFWEHSKGHIKTDKLLTCPKCPFVTEYKHHLEYHLRNHFGSKPFKCDKCSYSCVNKSMLNSHMKSHSNVYQYRCADCSYATKYCHSLKLHLRKYSHKPAMVLNIDGTPNPLPIIDVYGTRRGPKQKQHSKQEEIENSPQAIQSSLAQFMLNAPPQMQLPFPYPFLGGFPGAFANPLLLQQNLARLANQREAQELDERRKEMEDNDSSVPDDNISADENVGALDLSKPEVNQPAKNRRKGKAFKLDRSAIKHSSSDEDEEEHNVTSNHSDDASRDSVEEKIQAREKEEEITNNNKPDNYSCQFCCIAFGDVILYTMHMGYHGYKDPFTCNMCGEQCHDKVSFFLHIARTSHS